jgi:hypothetical protein
MVLLAGKLPNIRCIYTVLANPKNVPVAGVGRQAVNSLPISLTYMAACYPLCKPFVNSLVPQ